jgi:class 3 adenylate cyclase
MEPRIQYAKTSDGVSIAYATVGNGRPLVGMPPPAFSHVEHQWEFFGSFWQPLAQAFRIVMYDSRGAGLSDRKAIDFSMGAMIRDLEAVVEQAELRSFILFALGDGVPVEVTYAASHPDRVSHLVICDGWTKYSDYAETAASEVEASLREKDWVLFTETFAQVLWPFEDPALARQFAAFMRACSEPEAYRAAQAALESYDASALLSHVTAPTLVIHNRNNRFVPMQSGQRIAAGIRNARFVSIDDLTFAAVSKLIKEFVGEATKASGLAADAVHTILFTDVEGSTALTDRLGDAKARDLLREHERITREALKAHGGSEVKTLGDGFMASFSSATKALECAIAIQRAFGERNESAGEPIKVRIGLNAGEPIAEDDPDGRSDLFGASVNRAARIAAMAQGEEILVANVIRELAEGKGFMFGDRGETALRGFDDPVRLYEVRWREDG